MKLASLYSPRGLIGLSGLLSVGLVGGGLVLASTLNLAACPLCILQRMLYLLLAIQALPAWLTAKNRLMRGVFGLTMAVTALAGASIAGYQTWLQRFAAGTSCSGQQPWWEQFVDWAGGVWPLMFEATGLCSEAGWKFLRLSIAEWSLIAFTAMAIAMIYVCVGVVRNRDATPPQG